MDIVVVVSVSVVDSLKMTTLRALQKVARVIALVDNKFDDINVRNDDWNCETVERVVVDHAEFEATYGSKIRMFNGRWCNNAAKIAAVQWIARSDFDHVWYFEDDVFCKDWRAFFRAYERETVDLLAEIVPIYQWFASGWLVGSHAHRQHGAACLYACRISKRMASAIVEMATREEYLSHHELFIPWVQSLPEFGLVQKPLRTEHTYTMSHNISPRGSDNIAPEELHLRPGLIFHPVKLHDAVSERCVRNV